MEDDRAKNISGEPNEFQSYECLNHFRVPVITDIIRSLVIPLNSTGLDVGCGNGFVTKLLWKNTDKSIRITGMDISKEIIEYAKSNHQTDKIHFIRGDINILPFNDQSFDWVWSMDTIWPGPKKFDCPSEDPLPLIKEIHRVIKPGGSIFLSYWSSQKLLPGYPLLEAKLNTSSSATAPFTESTRPENHMMNAGKWLHNMNFRDINTKTFIGNINPSLSKNDQKALKILFQMLWDKSDSVLNEEERKLFSALTDEQSNRYILHDPNYCGFYTYTLFTGVK